jgi:hypothetical protein
LFSSRSKGLPRSLPPGPKRNDGEAAATATILVAASERFRTGHDKVTCDRAQIVGQGAGVRQSTKTGESYSATFADISGAIDISTDQTSSELFNTNAGIYRTALLSGRERRPGKHATREAFQRFTRLLCPSKI